MWLIWATYINMSSMVLSLTPTIHTSSLVCIMNTSGVEYYDLVTRHPETNPPEIKPQVTIESIQRLQPSLS